jgi:photosystem II stability/assembly factor-like uncharacterized protein
MNKTSFTDSFLIFTFILFFLLFSGEMLFCQIEQLNTENLKRENGIELLFQNRIPVLFSPQTTIFDRKDDEKFSYKNSFPDKQYRRIFSDTVLFHPVSGPYGGTVRSIAHDSGGWLFVATDGEVYRSKDNGLHWNMKLFPSQLHNYVEPITILGPNVIVAETDYNNYISTDRGESWDYLTDDVHGFTVETTGNIYAGSNYGGAKISIDTAKTWQQFALTGKKIWEVVLCGDGKFACPADSGIYYSSDKGITWKYKPYDTRFTWNLVSDKKGHLFVLKFFGQNFQLYKSSDFGESWQQIILGEWEDAYRIYVEEDGRLFVTTNERILISINAGETWEELAFPIGMPLTVGRDTAENLLAGSFEGLYRLNNISGEWEELNNGIHARRIEAIEFTSTGSILVISLGTCFRSTDFGNSWTVVELESNIRVYPYSPILSTSRGVIFIAACFDNYSECGLLRSTDDGVTWERISVLSNYYAIYEITEGSCGDILVATAYGDIYRSTDNGDCWYKVVSSHNQLEITALAADDLGNYYAAQDTSLLISQNGITWKEFTMSRGYASHESISIDNRNEIYFGSSSDGVYHSTDYGRTWNLLNNGLFEKYVISTTSDDSGNVVLGTSKGIFRLADSSNSWIWFSKGFPNTFAMSLSFSQNNFLFAGTQDFGMYRSIDPLEKRIPIIDQPPTININNFLLYQNYPNPFNDQTIIRYKVPFYSEIKIRIYNILGQMITTLFSGTLTEGVYSANWIPKVQSSGLYFCLMSATSGTKTYQKTIKILYLR